MIEKLERMLASGQDSPSLRFALATHYLKNDQPTHAIEHAAVAVTMDPDYSAAWRVLGQAQAQSGHEKEAATSFERGIEVAKRTGDRQVEKEMQVFLRRLAKSATD